MKIQVKVDRRTETTVSFSLDAEAVEEVIKAWVRENVEEIDDGGTLEVELESGRFSSHASVVWKRTVVEPEDVAVHMGTNFKD